MSDIEMQTEQIENSQAAQPGSTATTTAPDAQEPEHAEEYAEEEAQEEAQAQEDADAEAEAEAAEGAEAEAEAHDDQPQTATAKDDGIIRIMDPSGVSLRAFSESLIGDYALKDLTGDKSLIMAELPDIKARAQKEPEIEHSVRATYNFEYLEKAFKALKALGQAYITIEMAQDSPLCIHANRTDAMRGEWRFYLAPYMEQ